MYRNCRIFASIYLSLLNLFPIKKIPSIFGFCMYRERARARERERETERQTERLTDRDRERQTQRER